MLRGDTLLAGGVPPEMAWVAGCLGSEVRGDKNDAKGVPFGWDWLLQRCFLSCERGGLTPAFGIDDVICTSVRHVLVRSVEMQRH